MSNEKMKSVVVGEYLVSKNGAKYIKLSAKPNADEATKSKVAALIEAVGGEVLFINLFDAEFKEKYSVPDFKKGTISAPVDESSNSPNKSKSSKPSSGVDF